jgi:proteasome lid subunit RPN8/RPN11
MTATPRIRVLSRDLRQHAPATGDQPAVCFGFGQGMRRFRCPGEQRRPGDCDIVLTQSVYRRVVEHLKADTTREHGGLLLGLEVAAPGTGCATVVIVHALPAQFSEGTPVRLVLTEQTWAEFDRLTQQYAATGLTLKRVGWYHSHPNITIFLSRWDLDVCKLFDRPAQVALVIDPVQDRGAFFVRGSQGYRSDQPQGFIELCDLQPETVVTWSNVSEEAESRQGKPVPPSSNGDTLVPAPPADQGGERAKRRPVRPVWF